MGSLEDEASVSITVVAVNDAPAFASETTVRSVSESARPGDNVGPPIVASDVDDDLLTYRISGAPGVRDRC